MFLYIDQAVTRQSTMLYALYSNFFVHLVTILLQRTYFGLLMNAKEPRVNARLQGAPDRFLLDLTLSICGKPL